jgi:hypothetical protein
MVLVSLTGRLVRWGATSATAAVIAAVALRSGADLNPSPALDPAAERAARTYLEALVKGDAAVLVRLTPDKLENKYGPSPFVGTPRFDGARVDAHRAGVLFRATTKDPELPNQGAVSLTLLDHVTRDPWRVRQVAFFNRLPLGAKIPKRSITRKDKAQEPLVIEAARRYIAAWMRGDYDTMEYLAFDWIPRIRPVAGMRIRSIEFRARRTEHDEIKLNFTARVTMYKVLPKTLEGTLFALREDGEWKIRGTELTI